LVTSTLSSLTARGTEDVSATLLTLKEGANIRLTREGFFLSSCIPRSLWEDGCRSRRHSINPETKRSEARIIWLTQNPKNRRKGQEKRNPNQPPIFSPGVAGSIISLDTRPSRKPESPSRKRSEDSSRGTKIFLYWEIKKATPPMVKRRGTINIALPTRKLKTS